MNAFNLCICGGELEEVSRIGSKVTLRCEMCNKQRSEFLKREIASSIKVREWKSICLKCKKLFVGNKRYCSIRCWRKDGNVSKKEIDMFIKKQASKESEL